MSILKFKRMSRLLFSLAVAAGLAGLGGLVLTTTGARAQEQDNEDGPHVVRIEEDWSLLVSNPSYNLSCPQVSTQMAPDPQGNEFYQFHINYQDVPRFIQGGLQLQAWNVNSLVQVNTSTNTSTMGTANELVTWTQYLQRSQWPAGLTFGISTSASQTWGDFSGASFTVRETDARLDNYSPDYSAQQSGVTYGPNLVPLLVLVESRRYYSNGSVQTDSNPRVILANN
jgi:hypothetical protein